MSSFSAALAQIQRPSFLASDRYQRSDIGLPMGSTAKELREAILASMRMAGEPVSVSWLLGATDASRTRIYPALEDLESQGLICKHLVSDCGQAALWGINHE